MRRSIRSFAARVRLPLSYWSTTACSILLSQSSALVSTGSAGSSGSCASQRSRAPKRLSHRSKRTPPRSTPPKQASGPFRIGKDAREPCDQPQRTQHHVPDPLEHQLELQRDHIPRERPPPRRSIDIRPFSFHECPLFHPPILPCGTRPRAAAATHLRSGPSPSLRPPHSRRLQVAGQASSWRSGTPPGGLW